MIYNKVYRGQFTNLQTDSDNADDGKLVIINIYDVESGTAVSPTTIIDLDMADQPCTISTVDNDEDKFSVARSKQAVINIHSREDVGIETFVLGGDNRFYGEIFVGAQVKFRGWVSVADVQEDFLPDPNTIQLTMTDGLKFLGEQPLTGLTNEQTILDILQGALLNTGMALRIRVNMNVRESTASHLNDDIDGSGHFFKFISLDVKTFEKEIGTLEDCLSVITKTLKVACNITQHNGDWVVYLIDEFRQDRLFTYFIWDEDGVFVGKTDLSYQKFIGIASPMQWMNEDCLVTNNRPVKSITTKFDFADPLEIPCNKDFSRGTGTDPTGAADETIDYVLECWDYLREDVAPEDLDQSAFAGSLGVLRKRYELFYEKERYLATETAGGFRHYFKSEAIKVQVKDKINLGTSVRHEVDDGTVTINVAHIRLLGDDGSIWDWDYELSGTNEWVNKVATDAVFDSELQINVTGIDISQWQSFSATSLPLPVGGRLYIRLLNDVAPPIIRHFSNLSIDIVKYVNGSYQAYTSQQHKVEQSANFRSTIDETINITDAPHISMKGCLLKRGTDLEIFNGVVGFSGVANEFDITGDFRPIFKAGMKIIISGSASNDQTATITSVNYASFTNLTQVFIDGTTVSEVGVTVSIKIPQYILTEGFYDAAAFPDADYPDATYVKPFGEMQAFWLFNQHNRVMRNFEGTIDHLQMSEDLETDSGIPDLNYGFFLSDPNENSNNKYFQLLHCEQDYNLTQWTGFFSQVGNSGDPNKIFTGHSFKYLTQ